MRTVLRSRGVSSAPASLVAITMMATTAVVVVADNDATVNAAAPVVVLNELHYHAADDNPAAEFIELLNTTDGAIDLSGWTIAGVSYTFPAGSSIGARQFLVVPATAYEGALSNGGERIRLRNAANTTIDEVEYDDVGLWPANADGEGDSLQRRDPESNGRLSGNWLSAPPSPGAANSISGPGVLPTFTSATHTVLPAPGAPLTISARLAGGVSPRLFYRVNQDPEIEVGVTVSGTQVTAQIPGQSAGTLVRYRWFATSATNGTVGTWPRQGDGAFYSGTTVATTQTSKLPRLEWFMDAPVYNSMIRDLTLTGDQGYPAVLAYNGVIYDNARVRVKGQVSRFLPKKKLKFILAPGYELSMPGILLEPVDEFAMHGSWIDKSFLREVVASEIMTAAGVPASQALPMRLELNGGFYGLYTYVEQQDGGFRDRVGIDDSVVYEVGGGQQFGLLAATDAGLSQAALRAKYDKETFEWEDDAALREFIRIVNALRGPAEREWILDNMDVPSVVNMLATSMVIQHQDLGHKNYRLLRDEFGRWGMFPTDFDLTLGRRWSEVTGPTSEFVGVAGAFENPGGPLFETFFFDPVLSAMVRQRIRHLTTTIFEQNRIAARVAQLSATITDEAALDRQVWGTYGNFETAERAQSRMINSFVVPQYNRLRGTLANQGRVDRQDQPSVPAIQISAVQPVDGTIPEHVIITNSGPVPIDVSGFTINEIELVVPGGTIMQPGAGLFFFTEDFEGPLPVPNRWFGGKAGEELDDRRQRLTLATDTGLVIDVYDALSAGQRTQLSGLAGRTALVVVTAVDSTREGYLQVLPCAAAPGATSNVNTDGPGQIRASLAVVQFDGSGRACVYNNLPVHVVADLQAYLASSSWDGSVAGRLLDTRSGARLAAGQMTRINGLPNRSALIGLTAVDASPGFFQVLPCDATPGAASNLNVDAAGQNIANLATVRFGADGSACVFNQQPAHLIVDLQGYLAEGALDDVADSRLVDTRTGARPAAGSRTIITGTPDTSAIVNLTATEADPGFFQVLPCGQASGGSSNLNTDRGNQTRAASAIVRFDSAGQACVFQSVAGHIVVDLQAYFAPSALDDVADTRLADTRR
jgi:hypothetical protein